MNFDVKTALIKAAGTIEALLEENRRLCEKLSVFEKEARARKLYTQLRERGYFGDDADAESIISDLAKSAKLDSYEQILPELIPQTPPWKVSGERSATGETPADAWNNWVMTGRFEPGKEV